MARVSLARQQLSDAGVVPVYSPAVAEGHAVENDGRIVLHIFNTREDPVTVTIQTAYVRAGLKLADRVVEIPAQRAAFIGPFSPDVYNQSDGTIYVGYSAVDGVTVAALLVPVLK